MNNSRNTKKIKQRAVVVTVASAAHVDQPEKARHYMLVGGSKRRGMWVYMGGLHWLKNNDDNKCDSVGFWNDETIAVRLSWANQTMSTQELARFAGLKVGQILKTARVKVWEA